MLENSNLLEGSKAKRVNELLHEYQDVSAKIKDLETTKKNVLAELFELADVGINETGKFVFNIVKNDGSPRVQTKALREKAPILYEQIEQLGFITEGKGFLTVRGIKLKGDRS